MADGLEKSSKKLIDKYLKVKPVAQPTKKSNFSNYNQGAEAKEEFK
jgi:hypothetical protein